MNIKAYIPNPFKTASFLANIFYDTTQKLCNKVDVFQAQSSLHKSNVFYGYEGIQSGSWYNGTKVDWHCPFSAIFIKC